MAVYIEELDKREGMEVDSFYDQGEEAYASGDFVRALALFTEEWELGHSGDCLNYMGTYYYEVEDYVQAQQCYEQSLKLNEAQSETHLNLGMCYVRMSDSKSAFKEFERASELDPSCYDAVRNKGLVLLEMREFRAALDAFGLAAKIQPDETECMTGIIYCHAKLKDYETALRIARKLLELEPGSNQALRFIEKLEVSVTRQIHGES